MSKFHVYSQSALKTIEEKLTVYAEKVTLSEGYFRFWRGEACIAFVHASMAVVIVDSNCGDMVSASPTAPSETAEVEPEPYRHGMGIGDDQEGE